MGVEDRAVKEIEYVAREDRGDSHSPPILGEAVNAKCLGDDRRVAAKEKAIRESSEGGEVFEIVWVFDVYGAKLGNKEDQRGNDETPRAGNMKSFDHKVRARAYVMLA